MTSTPISKIPVSNQPPQEEEDPEVLAILQEMQQSNSTPNLQKLPQQVLYPNPPPLPPVIANIVTVPTQHWFKQDLAQRALIAALIAYFIFQLKSIDTVYVTFPILEKLQPYDFVIRILLLAVVLYLLMWKFNL